MMKRAAAVLLFLALLVAPRVAMGAAHSAWSLPTCLASSTAPIPPSQQCVDYVNIWTGCQNETFPTTGTIKYFCDCQSGADVNCVAGDDTTGAGTKASPWKTITKMTAQANSLPAGSTIAGCKGGSFTNSGIDNRMQNLNVTTGSPLLIRDYDPSIAGGGTFNPAIPSNPITVVASSSKCFEFSSGTTHQNGGYRLLNWDCEGATTTGNLGLSTSNGLHDLEMCNVVINNVQQAIFNAGNNSYANSCFSYGPPIVDNCGNDTNITIHGCTIQNSVQGGYLGGANNLMMRANVFNVVGSDGSADHAIYMSANVNSLVSTGNPYNFPYQNQTFQNNLFINVGTGVKCDGVQFVAHGWAPGMQVLYNYFVQNPGFQTVTGNCFPIQFDSGDAAPVIEAFPGLLVRGNYAWNFGGVGIGIGNAMDAEIDSNILDQTATNSGALIQVNAGGASATSLVTKNISIWNNTTIYESTANNEVGIQVNSAGSGFDVRNNVIYSKGTGTPFIAYQYLLGRNALLGGTAASTVSSYTGTTNGGFDITLNGTLCQVTGLNFSAALYMGDIAAAIQTKLAACLANTKASWTGSKPPGSQFLINLPFGSTNTITVASTPTGTGSPTDVSTLLALTAGAGAAVTANISHWDYTRAGTSGVTLAWEAAIGNSLATWQGFGFDTHSSSGAPAFFSLTGVAAYAPTYNSAGVVNAGNSVGLTTDFQGAPRLPDIGALNRYVGGATWPQ